MFDQIFLRKPGEDLHYVIQLTYMYLNPDELVFVVTFQQFSSRQSVLIHTNVLNHSRNHKMHHTSDANYSNNSSPRLVIEAGGDASDGGKSLGAQTSCDSTLYSSENTTYEY